MAEKDKFEESPWYCAAAHGILEAGDPYRSINRPSPYNTKPILTRSFDLGDLTPVDYFRKHGKIGNFVPDTSEDRGDYDEFSKARPHFENNSDDDAATIIHHEDLSEADQLARLQMSYNSGLGGVEKQVHWGVDTAFDGSSDRGSVVTEYTIKRESSPGIEEEELTYTRKASGPEWIEIPAHDRPYGDYVSTAQEGRHRTSNQHAEKPKSTGGNHTNKSSHSHHTPPSYRLMLDGASPAEMKLQLFDRLLHNFPEDRFYLEQAMGVFGRSKARKHRSESDIHVFVDFSNIKIGFQELMYVLCGQPPKGTMALPLLNFDNLTWILERGRPISARHLAGSQPMREQDEAEACNYKCNLLDRVLKVPHETPRKRAFRLRSEGYTSGSEGVDPAPRYVEQGVDEVLNMLMSQTGFSVKEPATLVLASGDGAPSEYSSGYFDLVQTFLKRDWKVEIYSFKRNLSHLYQAPGFRRRWGSRFKIIELDEYCLSLIQKIED